MYKSLASVVLLAATANAVTISNTTTLTATRTRTTAVGTDITSAPTGTGKPCCYLRPMNAGLGEWYTSSLTATVATVITEYIQYNNTVVTTSTTVFNETATQTEALGLQFLISGNNIYGYVTALTETSTVWSGTTLVAPTPFWEFFDVRVGSGTLAYTTRETGVEEFCKTTSEEGRVTPHFMYYPSSPPFFTSEGGISIGQDFATSLIDELAKSGTTNAGLDSCTLLPGTGAPRVHVAVSALTDHASTTRRTNAIFPTTALPIENKPTITPAPQPDPPAPITNNPPPPPPETTRPGPVNPGPSDEPNRPPQNPPSNNPGPSNNNPGPSNNNPGPSNNNPGPSNNNPGPSNNNPGPSNNPGPAPTNGNGPRPTNQPAPIVVPSITVGTSVVPVAPVGTVTNGGVIIGGSTLLPSSAVVIGGNTISLAPSGSNVVIVGTDGPSTVPIFAPAPGAPVITGSPQPASSIVVGGETIPVQVPSNTEQGVVLPGGTTLAPGSVVTFNGQTLSLAPGGSSIVVESSGAQSTVSLYTPAANDASATVLNVGSSAYTVGYVTAPGGGVVLPGGQTLLPGSTTVVDGTTISLGSEGTALVVGSSTASLRPATTTDSDASTTTGAEGSYIWSGLGGGTPSASSTQAEFTAGAGKGVDRWRAGAGFAAAAMALREVVF